MKNIVIIGTGNAALLHYTSYKKIQKIGNIYFVDNDISKKTFLEYPIYHSLFDVLKENKISYNNVIVDICTPQSQFLSIIEEIIQLGIKDIIVEKPFVVDENYFVEKANINIISISNYLYSKITTLAKKIIEERKLIIRYIHTNFSKNRIKDSFNGRAIREEIPSVLEIEMPHQIYLANYFLTTTENPIMNYCSFRDMKNDNGELKNHAQGTIIITKENVSILHESDLTTSTLQKRIIIHFKNNISMELRYIHYDTDFTKISDGYLSLYEKGILIEKYLFEEDDNMLYCLNDIYTYLNNGKYDRKYNIENRIIEFSKEMNLYRKYINDISRV